MLPVKYDNILIKKKIFNSKRQYAEVQFVNYL